MLPTGWQQALTVLLIVIPGFVYQGLLSKLRGPTPEDRELGKRVLRSLAASGLFALVYVVALGSYITAATVSSRSTYVDHPVRVALVLLALVFVIPAVVAVVHHGYVVWRKQPDLPWRDYLRVYDPTPTAWDWAVNRLDPGYVRVLTKDGKWFGGYAGERSFYTSHTGAREVFVERAWELDVDGDFVEEVKNNTGRWIQCADALVVEFVRPDDQASPDQDSGGIASRLTDDVVVGAVLGAAGAMLGAAGTAVVAIAIGERFRRAAGIIKRDRDERSQS